AGAHRLLHLVLLLLMSCHTRSSCIDCVLSGPVAVTPGGAADLQCQTPGAAAATVVEWTKDGLPASEYVFFYRNGRPYEKYQHDSFRGRVALKNRSGPGSGDVSVVLKNVSVEDEGTYRCRVRMSSSGTEAEEHLQVSRLRVALRSGTFTSQLRDSSAAGGKLIRPDLQETKQEVKQETEQETKQETKQETEQETKQETKQETSREFSQTEQRVQTSPSLLESSWFVFVLLVSVFICSGEINPLIRGQKLCEAENKKIILFQFYFRAVKSFNLLKTNGDPRLNHFIMEIIWEKSIKIKIKSLQKTKR
uniref:Ig-like domain-containing protein n=1 Tax=Poecilia mexicana TaxID=48701 RepID=A0A3B3YEC9_9TELE